MIIIDKCLILIFEFFYITNMKDLTYAVVFFLLSIITTCLLTLFPFRTNKTIFYGTLTVNLFLSIIYPDYLPFLALCLLECAYQKQYKILPFFLLPFFQCAVFLQKNMALPLYDTLIQKYGLSLSCLITAFYFIIAFYLGFKTRIIETDRAKLIQLKDIYEEKRIDLKKENKNLLMQQDYEINIATLNERNRIAREIHDNVGHMLSRSILQIGALIAINKDPAIQELYQNLKNTLNQAMDNIRNSVHDLHDESIDLNHSIETLIQDFTFCPVQYEFDASEHINKNIKYSFIAITKEALNNIMKHSNATLVSIHIIEHPAFYQLKIEDNGNTCTKNINSLTNSGIGLANMQERIQALHGSIRITNKNGFLIFISIPKDSEHYPTH